MKHTAFLSVMDYSTDELAHLFDVAIDLKKKLKASVPTRREIGRASCRERV